MVKVILNTTCGACNSLLQYEKEDVRKSTKTITHQDRWVTWKETAPFEFVVCPNCENVVEI